MRVRATATPRPFLDRRTDVAKQMALIENGEPRIAKTSEIELAATAHYGGQHGIGTIRLWSESERNVAGIYSVNVVRETLGAFQDYGTPTLTFNGTSVTQTLPATDLSLERAKEQALSQIAARRYQAETGGVEAGGVPVATDRDSQGKYTAARIIAKEDANYTVNWKTDAGFQTFDATTLIAVADAVRAHIQACFDREAALAADINNAADLTALRAIDLEAGWPANPGPAG